MTAIVLIIPLEFRRDPIARVSRKRTDLIGFSADSTREPFKEPPPFTVLNHWPSILPVPAVYRFISRRGLAIFYPVGAGKKCTVYSEAKGRKER